MGPCLLNPLFPAHSKPSIMPCTDAPPGQPGAQSKPTAQIRLPSLRHHCFLGFTQTLDYAHVQLRKDNS